MKNEDPVSTEYIRRYCRAMGRTALFSAPSPAFFLSFLTAGRDKVLISGNKLLRGAAQLKRMKHMRYATAKELAEQYFALRDAFLLLARKGVPVYFYNRIGQKKKDYAYREQEQVRMAKGLSFPVMYRDIPGSEEQLKAVFGERYSREYVEAIGRIPQVIKVGSMYQHEDCSSELVNVVGGKRVTCGQPERYARTIHVYGRCGAFGYAVEDRDTLPSLLQQELKDRGITDIRVVNHGLWGGVDEYLDHNFLQDAIGMKEGDIVLFYRKHFDKKLLRGFQDRGVRYRELTEEWHAQRDETVTFFDKPGHMNAEGYRLTARLICDDLLATGLTCGEISPEAAGDKAEDLNHYLKSGGDEDFQREVEEYIASINAEHPLTEEMRNNGAIVMNCNPFTNGHRYLAETAAAQVDRLYLFVVEEDKSFFAFADRLEMVRRGTADIPNVVVVPSGKFIISAYTFPEYFMKDYVKEKSFDVSMDVETFCRYIAPPLNIRVRFAGEEPFDPVTKNYNENMARILPEHGMRFAEVPRLAIDGERVVNATRVRELLKNRELEELKEYVPRSTYDILMEKYMD